MLFAVLFSSILVRPGRSLSNPIRTHVVAVGSSPSFSCSSIDPPIWNRIKTLDDVQGLSGPVDVQGLAVGDRKMRRFKDQRYTFAKEGTLYTLTITDVRSSDAGKFVCDGESSHQFHLTVLGLPQCKKTEMAVAEDERRVFTCAANITDLTQDGVGEIIWRLGNETLPTNTQTQGGRMTADYSYVARYADQGKELSCSLRHTYLEAETKTPSCSFGKLDIQFEPKIECDAIIMVRPHIKSQMVSCIVRGNPLPNENDISWKVGEEEVSTVVSKRNDGGLDVGFALSSSIEAQLESDAVVLEVTNPSSRDQTIRRSVVITTIIAPEIACPKNIKTEKNAEGFIKIGCDIYVSPVPPASNISWYIEKDLDSRQSQLLMTEITNGVHVDFEFNPEKYGLETMSVHLKVKALAGNSDKEIDVTISDMQQDAIYPNKKNRRPILNNNMLGILLLTGFTVVLLLVTSVVCLIVFRKNVCRHNQGSNFGDEELGSISLGKGTDDASGAFTYMQPSGNSFPAPMAPNPIMQSGTMTVRLMKNMKKSSRTEDWTIGFAKLANALYLKDADQDGYLTVEEAKPVVLSYSEIYDLGISEEKVEDSLSQCSNGHHVDVETFLHLLSIA